MPGCFYPSKKGRRRPNENVTVLFLVDRSLSIPEEFGDDPRRPGVRTDLRALRVRDFIENSVEEWGKRHLQMIYFGREHCPARNHDGTECPICSWAS